MPSYLLRKKRPPPAARVKHVRHLVPNYLASSVVLIDEQKDEAFLLVLDSDQDLDETQLRGPYPG